MKKTIKILNQLEDNFCAVILAIMTVLAFINVIARYVFLASYPWVEELNKLGLVIMTYVGAAVALKNHSHLGLSIITDRLPPIAQKVISVIGCGFGLFFCYIGIKYGYSMAYNEFTHHVTTQGMQWPEGFFGMWLPIGCVVLAIRFVQQAVYVFIKKEETEE